MADQKQQRDRRADDLAARIFERLAALAVRTKTPEALAQQALADARAFFRALDAKE